MASMNTLQLTRPAPIDLVAAEGVERDLEREHSMLVRLQEQAVSASERASELERQMWSQGLDPETTSWMLLRFQQYLVTLRHESDDEVEALLSSARQQARLIRRRQPVSVAFAGALGVSTSDWFEEIVAREHDSICWAPLEVEAPRLAAEVDRPTVTVVAVAEAAVAHAHSEESSLETDEAGSHDDRPFWPTDTHASWWRRGRLSAAGVLQVCAGFLMVAAVAVHFA